MNGDGVVEQLGDVDGLGDAAAARVGLLRGHDVADVPDVSGDRRGFGLQVLVLGDAGVRRAAAR